MLGAATEAWKRRRSGSGSPQSGFAVKRSGEGGYVLELAGSFLPGWSGSLANGLAQHGIGIVRGFARKLEGLRWEACFELEPTPCGDDPLVLDYRELASRPLQAGARLRVRLDGFELRTSAAHGGCIELRVEGADQVGFLGAMLKRFAFLALFPEAMAIDTTDGRVRDVFWLRGIGRTVPSDESRGALGRALRRLEAPETRPGKPESAA